MTNLWVTSLAFWLSASLFASGYSANSMSAPDSNIRGSWSENCSVLEGGGGSIGLSYSFTGTDIFADNLFINGNVYSDTNCQHIALSHIFYGRYQAGGRYGDGFELDFSFDRRFVTGFHPDDIRAMNEINYCGYSDWRFGISKLVAIKSCDNGFAPKRLAAMMTKINTIFDIRTSKGYTYLVFGQNTSDGSRPTRLDLSRKYIRN